MAPPMPDQALWTGSHQSARLFTTAMQVGHAQEGHDSSCHGHCIAPIFMPETIQKCRRGEWSVFDCSSSADAALLCAPVARMHVAESYDDLDAGWAADIFGIPDMRQQLLSLASGNVLEVQTIQPAASPCS